MDLRVETFANAVFSKLRALAKGDPEDQLRAPFERLLEDIGPDVGGAVIAKGESSVERIGRPDYVVLVDGLVTGYAELKAPGKGADPTKFKGHDRNQWKRFSTLPNVLYTDGNEWRLYQEGELAVPPVGLPGGIERVGGKTVDAASSAAVVKLLKRFLQWRPIVPKSVPQLAKLLAPICRNLREDVLEALKDQNSPVHALAADWRDLLFPTADDERFADAYAQTVTFALLLARAEGAPTLDYSEAVRALRSEHALLSKALEVLTDVAVRKDIGPSVALLQRIVEAVDPAGLDPGMPDPWLYFYEDFLAEYDPELRRDYGAYYTPVEVVQAQTRICSSLLADQLGLKLGFADPSVVTLDPGVGTGTYLLGVVDRAAAEVAAVEGTGAVSSRMSELAGRMFGFEIMTGPYAVAELRVRAQLTLHGAKVTGSKQVFLTDTLESPHAAATTPGLFYAPMAKEHEAALRIKEEIKIFVCLGNPPYDRHPADSDMGRWIREGDPSSGTGEKKDAPSGILDDFTAPVREAGKGVHLKNLYNLYVYFWRWAIWKVFEHKTAKGPGIVSFITASSFLQGQAFAGMREKLRREADEIWIIDLGGEGRGTRQDENVFSIKTPVAIATALRYGDRKPDELATVRYVRIPHASRSQKLNWLRDVRSVDTPEWEHVTGGWASAFVPSGEGRFFSWPSLPEVFPWRHSGAQVYRTWPISPTPENLELRWRKLLAAETHLDKAELFRESRDRKIGKSYLPIQGGDNAPALASVDEKAPTPPIVRYGFRSFDRQWILADSRLGDYLRPVLWPLSGTGHLFLVTLTATPVGPGPALTASASVPDYHYFSGRGGKDVMPLWRDSATTVPNVTRGFTDVLAGVLGLPVSTPDVAAYVFGILSSREYTEQFFAELAQPDGEDPPGPRIPFTKNRDLFGRIRDLGFTLIPLHTGEAFAGVKPPTTGSAKNVSPVQTDPEVGWPTDYNYDETRKELIVGGGRFAPVSQTVWNYEVSGLHVIGSWLEYRTGRSYGRKSSPLDDLHKPGWTATTTKDLLGLLWRLEQVVDLEKEQGKALEAVLAGPLFEAIELPQPTDAEIKAPDTDRSDLQLDLLAL